MVVKISTRGGLGVLPLILLFALMSLPLYAAGDSSEGYNPKDELKKAEALRLDGRLDEAIEILIAIARYDPEQIGRVQKEILSILNEKKQIDDQFAEIIAALEEGDHSKVAAAITLVKSLDTEPNRNTLNKLILAINAISKSINNSIRDMFFDAGNRLLDSGEYSAAIAEYRQGFIRDENVPDRRYTEPYSNYIRRALGQSDFLAYENDPQREEIVKEAYSTVGLEGEATIDLLNSALDQWEVSSVRLESVKAAQLSIVQSSPIERWQNAVNSIISVLPVYEDDILMVIEITDKLNEHRLDLNAALNEIPEEFRYERIIQFMRGRIGETHGEVVNVGQEGILLAMETQWKSVFLDLAETMRIRIAAMLESGRENYRGGNWNSAVEDFEDASSASRVLLELLNESRVYITSLQSAESTRFADTLHALEAYRAYLAPASDVWIDLTNLAETLALTNLPDDPSLENVDDANIAVIQEGIDRVETLQVEWNTTDAELEQMPGATSEHIQGIDTALRNDLTSALETLQANRLDRFINAIQPLFAILEEKVRNAVSVDLVPIRELINRDPVLSDEELPERRPSTAMNDRIAPALTALDDVENSIDEFGDIIEEMLNRQPELDDSEVLLGFQEQAQELLRRVVSTQESLRKEEADAVVFITAARLAESKANSILDTAAEKIAAAQAAVARGEQNNDIEELNRAVDLYNAVDEDLDDVDKHYLEIWINDIDLAQASGVNETRTSLRNRAQQDRNRIAINVKQTAISEGKAAYEDGRYPYAKVVLSQAQEFYLNTYDKEDPELAGWLQRVENALNALGKTIIAPNDPLYPEMHQYLNLANRYYREGLLEQETNPGTADILRAYTSARELLNQVLLVFPGNRAAQLLESRILWETDAELAGRNAAELIQRAQIAIRNGNVEDLIGRNDESGIVSELYILKDIRPAYPNLDSLILSAEIAAGIRPEPLDPAKVAESRRLSDEAWTIFSNLGNDGAERALDLLDQALALWIDNQVASDRKNRIHLGVRPEVLPPFPPELLALVNSFDQFFAQKNYIVCQALLNRITSEFSQFRKDPRIEDRILKLAPWL